MVEIAQQTLEATSAHFEPIKPRVLPSVFADPTLTLEKIREENPAYLKDVKVAGAKNIEAVKNTCGNCGAITGLCSPACSHCGGEKPFLYIEDETTNPAPAEAPHRFCCNNAGPVRVGRDDERPDKEYTGGAVTVVSKKEVAAVRANRAYTEAGAIAHTIIAPEITIAANTIMGACLTCYGTLGSSTETGLLLVDESGKVIVGKDARIAKLLIGKGAKVILAPGATVDEVQFCEGASLEQQISFFKDPGGWLKKLIGKENSFSSAIGARKGIHEQEFENVVRCFIQPQRPKVEAAEQ